VVAPTAVVQTEEQCVLAANARSAAELAAAVSAHSGWALADYSVGLRAHDSVPAVVPVAQSAVGSVLAYLVPAGSDVLRAHD